ncbi:MAG: 4Fe-4S binding protein [Candidatus Glassbacteria bacterium]
MEGKSCGKRDELIKKNEKEYGLSDNASDLRFTGGKVVSRAHIKRIRITVDLRYCKGCGICTERCPTQALRMVKEEGKLKQLIQVAVTQALPTGVEVGKEANLTWQALPHHAGLIVATGEESDNLTGAWRVGEVMIPDANHCVDCGVCSQVCPEGIIDVELEE